MSLNVVAVSAMMRSDTNRALSTSFIRQSRVGACEIDGEADGIALGLPEGEDVGDALGLELGVPLGLWEIVGEAEGLELGSALGVLLWTSVGNEDGDGEGR